MDKIKVAKELVKLAKNLIALSFVLTHQKASYSKVSPYYL